MIKTDNSLSLSLSFLVIPIHHSSPVKVDALAVMSQCSLSIKYMFDLLAILEDIVQLPTAKPTLYRHPISQKQYKAVT